MKHVFQVEMAHKTHGPNYTHYTVVAKSAKEAITKAERQTATANEYAFEVKHIATLD